MGWSIVIIYLLINTYKHPANYVNSMHTVYIKPEFNTHPKKKNQTKQKMLLFHIFCGYKRMNLRYFQLFSHKVAIFKHHLQQDKYISGPVSLSYSSAHKT